MDEGDDILSQALHEAKIQLEDDLEKSQLTQQNYIAETDTQLNAVEHAVDISGMGGPHGPCEVGARAVYKPGVTRTYQHAEESSTISNDVTSEKGVTKTYLRANESSTSSTDVTSEKDDKDDEEKEAFYDSLQKEVDRTPHDMLVIMGDFNAKVGSENRGKENIMGRQGTGTPNSNGERLATFCQENNLVIGGTLFTHKNIHKTTWTSPDGHTENQIDHIIINNRWRSSLQDVVARRGADVGSDHTLVLAKVKLKLRQVKKKSQRPPQVNIDRLKDPTLKKSFQIEVKNRFSVLQEKDKVELQEFNTVLLETGKELLGPQRRKKEEWIRENTWKVIEKRKEQKKKILNTKSERQKEQLAKGYRTLDKEVKRRARSDKQAYVEKLAEEAEAAAANQDMRTLYGLTRTLSGRNQTSTPPVKNKQGITITKEEEILNCWREHFERVLNREEPEIEAHILLAKDTLNINTDPPTVNEVKRAIKTLKNGKSPGVDQINAEMLKAEENMTPALLTNILKSIWESEEPPDAWKTGLIVKLPKKGDLTNCDNWRGIMLLSTTSKVLSRVILNRLSTTVDPLLRKEQAGFRKGKSCTDQIFTLRQIVEQSNEWNATVYTNYIDFSKAFDSVNRTALWRILVHYGIPDKITSIIKMLYTTFSARVICGSSLSEELKLKTGVRQGCLLSPILFTLCIDWLMKETTRNVNRGISWTFNKSLEDLDFADDIALLSHRFNDMKEKTNVLATTGSQIGLKINANKTKVMKINGKATEAMTLGDTTFEEVQEFTYLGSTITANGDSEADVRARIGKARYAFTTLRNIWKSNRIKVKTKLQIFKSNILGILLYGAESWKVTQNISNKLDVFQTRCLRRILRIYWPNTISNEELYNRTNTIPLSQVIKKRKWRYIGHMHATDGTRCHSTYSNEMDTTRKEKQRKAKRNVEKICGKRNERSRMDLGTDVQQWAQDRQYWRSLVEALCAPSTKRIT